MADAPALDARAAHVIWDPAICPGVIPVKAERAKGRSGLRLDELPAAVTIVRDVSGTQHVLLQQGGHTLQLAASGADVRRPVRLLTELALEKAHVPARLGAIERFNRLCHRGWIDQGKPGEGSGFARFALVLKALDGFLMNWSQREIAERLFGGARARRDWRHPGGHMRDCVRRAIRRGCRLMESDYRLLLR
jgi:hypothetical protein